MTAKAAVFAYLAELNIPYTCTEHEAAFTVEDVTALGLTHHQDICKNLFLRDAQKKRHFLVVMQQDKQADLAQLQQQIGCSRLSFASPQRLLRYLGLHQGEVSPCGLLNDSECQVEVLLDADLLGKARLGVHPNDNRATIWLSAADLQRMIEAHGNSLRTVEI